MSSNPGSISAALAPYASAAAPSPNNVVSLPTPAHWFNNLRGDEKVDVVTESLKGFDNQTSDPRERWLQIIFAVADAGRLGCPGARELALAWSQRGAGWSVESDFDVAYNSYKPGAGTTIGSLLAAASDAGVDLSPWRNVAFTRAQQVVNSSTQNATTSATAIVPTVLPSSMTGTAVPTAKSSRWA